MSFTQCEVMPGVHHIQDAMGVCMTLLIGDQAALLVDTGYGLEDVRAYVRTLTDLPLTVLLTHGHHDHCMGARWFEQTLMFAQDQADFTTYTGSATRQRIIDSALTKGLSVCADEYLAAYEPMPLPMEEQTYALGGFSAQVIHCPGHTPGSCVVYVPEHQLLLTGDDWNPCTWLFFPAALDVYQYRSNVQALLKLPFTHVLCSHQPIMFEREKFESFMNGLTDSVIRDAKPVSIPPYLDIQTHQAEPSEGQILVFDYAKAMNAKKLEVD